MADTPWTKGPWRVQAKIDIWIMSGSLHVATIPRAADGDWSPHNARLIAAAPEMADALADFVAMGEQYGWDTATTGRDILMRNARAALAKALGDQ